MVKKPKTNPKGLNPSRTYKTTKKSTKKKRGYADIDQEGVSTPSARSAAAKKGWVTRRKNEAAAKRKTSRKKK